MIRKILLGATAFIAFTAPVKAQDGVLSSLGPR
jgi:hypothetical protein